MHSVGFYCRINSSVTFSFIDVLHAVEGVILFAVKCSGTCRNSNISSNVLQDQTVYIKTATTYFYTCRRVTVFIFGASSARILLHVNIWPCWLLLLINHWLQNAPGFFISTLQFESVTNDSYVTHIMCKNVWSSRLSYYHLYTTQMRAMYTEDWHCSLYYMIFDCNWIHRLIPLTDW